MRHKSLDDILIAVMGLAALISLFMLYGNRLWTKNAGDETRVASIVEQLQTVKRKRDFYQGWMDVKSGDSLSPNDEIYTHAQSSVKIQFDNGPEISLLENSLLRIKKEINQPHSLSLERGQINARLSAKSSKLNLEIGNKKYSFESSQADIQIEQGEKENKFLVVDGSAKFNSGQEIKADQIVVENRESGKVTVQDVPFKPLFPSQEAVTFFNKEASIEFKWKAQGTDASGTFLLAKDSEFKTLAASTSAADLSSNQVLNEAGTYFWKITNTEGLSSQTRSFTLIKEEAPVVSSDKTILYQAATQPGKIFLNWPAEKNSKPAKNYLLRFEGPAGAGETSVKGQSFEWTPGGTFGRYNVSVKVQEKTRPEAVWSAPLSIDVLEEKAVEIYSAMPEYLERLIYDEAASSLLLSWQGPQNDFKYQITLINNKKKALLAADSPSALLSLKEAGLYEWSVQGTSPSGIKTNMIKGKILLKKPLKMNQAPAAGSIIELERPDQLVNFKWKEIGQSSYEFELSRDQDFTQIVQKNEVTTNALSTVVGQNGKYFWRVKVKGKNSIDYSSPVSVELRPSPPLKSPESIPDLNLKLRYQQVPETSFLKSFFSLLISEAMAEDPIAVTEWDLPPSARARDYIVEIYSDRERKNLVTRIESKVPHVIWKNARTGTFYWQVAYVDYWGRQTDFSKLSVLKTEDDEESKKEAFFTIELDSPAHREKILEEIDDDYEFSWEAEGKRNFQFLISRDLEFSEPLLEVKLKKNETVLTCSQLPPGPGDYYWKVLSGNHSSKRRQFSVSCPVPPPASVEEKIEIASDNITAPIVIYTPAYHFASAGLFPHKLTYENKAAGYSAKVDGTVISAVALNYLRPVEWKWFKRMGLAANISRGKVFEKISFNDFDLTLKLLIPETSFSWGPILGLMKKTLYVEAGRTIADSALSSPFLGVTIMKDTEKFLMSAKAAGGTLINFGGSLQYKVKGKYAVGPFVEMTSATKDEGKHSFTQVGIKLDALFMLNENQSTGK